MTDAKPLAGKTLLMSGGSRGIGLAIALRAARDGANIALLAKTDQPHPKLEGTVHTAAAAIVDGGALQMAMIYGMRAAEPCRSSATCVTRTRSPRPC